MNDRDVTTPADLGARSSLLADKHAAYIKRVAEVSLRASLRTRSMFITSKELISLQDNSSLE